RGATISGHVSWPDGRPAKVATVQAADMSEKRPSFFGASRVRGATSDEHGGFTIRGLGKGPFLVTASARELEKKRADGAPSSARAEAASSSDPSASADPAESDAGATDGSGKEESADSAPRSKKAILLVATQEDVQAGTQDLSLVLHAPAGLKGRVIDGSGA